MCRSPAFRSWGHDPDHPVPGHRPGTSGHRPLPSVPPFLRLWENLDGGTRKEMPLPLLSALLGGKTLREQAFVTQGCSSATTGRAE